MFVCAGSGFKGKRKKKKNKEKEKEKIKHPRKYIKIGKAGGATNKRK